LETILFLIDNKVPPFRQTSGVDGYSKLSINPPNLWRTCCP